MVVINNYAYLQPIKRAKCAKNFEYQFYLHSTSPLIHIWHFPHPHLSSKSPLRPSLWALSLQPPSLRRITALQNTLRSHRPLPHSTHDQLSTLNKGLLPRNGTGVGVFQRRDHQWPHQDRTHAKLFERRVRSLEGLKLVGEVLVFAPDIVTLCVKIPDFRLESLDTPL